jgi:hypothetical protein
VRGVLAVIARVGGALADVRALLFRMPQRSLELLGQCFAETPLACRIRGQFYRPFLGKCGRNFQVAINAKLEHCRSIEVGNDVYIGHGSWLSGSAASVQGSAWRIK